MFYFLTCLFILLLSVAAGGGLAVYLRDRYLQEEAEREYAEWSPMQTPEKIEEAEENHQEPDAIAEDAGAVETEPAPIEEPVPDMEPESLPSADSFTHAAETSPAEEVSAASPEAPYDPNDIFSDMMRTESREDDVASGIFGVDYAANEGATQASLPDGEMMESVFPDDDDEEMLKRVMENLSHPPEEASESSNKTEIPENHSPMFHLSELGSELLGKDFKFEEAKPVEPEVALPETEKAVLPKTEPPAAPSAVSPSAPPPPKPAVAAPTEFSDVPVTTTDQFDIYAPATAEMVTSATAFPELPPGTASSTFSLPLIERRRKKKSV